MTTDGRPCASSRREERSTSASSPAARCSRSCRARASTTACATSSAGSPTRALRDAPLRRVPLVHLRVLLELRIENLLLIERAELRPGDGPDGDHGRDRRREDRAGARARPAARRQAAPRDRAPGRAGGVRRGVFELPPGCSRSPSSPDLRERVGDRPRGGRPRSSSPARVSAEGRTRAFVQGRSATAADLAGARRPAGRLLRAARAPEAHARLGAARPARRLLRARPARAARHAGRGPRAHARGSSGSSRSCASAPARATATSTCSPSRSRRSRRSTREEEKDALPAERARLRQLDGLLAAAGGGAEAIAPERRRARRGRPSRRGRAVSSRWPADPEMHALAERSPAAAGGRGPRRRAAPLRRLAGGGARAARRGRGAARALRPPRAQARRQRRGGARARRALPRERDRLERAEVETERAEAALAEARAERDKLAAKVTARRRPPPPGRSGRVRAGEPRDGGRRSSRSCSSRDEIGPSGAERVEFLLAPNPACPPRPSARRPRAASSRA